METIRPHLVPNGSSVTGGKEPEEVVEMERDLRDESIQTLMRTYLWSLTFIVQLGDPLRTLWSDYFIQLK